MANGMVHHGWCGGGTTRCLLARIALLSVYIASTVVVAAAPCGVYSWATVTAPVTLEDPDCTVESATFTGPSAVLLIDLDHLAHGEEGCLIRVSLLNVSFADGAVLQVVGGGATSSSVMVDIAVEGCSFTDSLLVVANVALSNNASMLNISGCTMAWSTDPGAGILAYFGGGGTPSPVLLANVSLANGSTLSLGDTSVSIGAGVGVACNGVQTAGVTSVASAAALLIDGNSITANNASVAVGTVSVVDGALVRINGGKLVGSCNGVQCYGVLLFSAVNIRMGSALLIDGNTIAMSTTSSTQNAYSVFATSAGAITVTDSSVLSVASNDITATSPVNTYGIYPPRPSRLLAP